MLLHQGVELPGRAGSRVQYSNLLNNDLNIIVYNFVDMLSHARTEMEVLKELASDEISYRSITASWSSIRPCIRR